MQQDAPVIKFPDSETWPAIVVGRTACRPRAGAGALHLAKAREKVIDCGAHRRAPSCHLRFGFRLREGLILPAKENQPFNGLVAVECRAVERNLEPAPVPPGAGFLLVVMASTPIKPQGLYEARRRSKL